LNIELETLNAPPAPTLKRRRRNIPNDPNAQLQPGIIMKQLTKDHILDLLRSERTFIKSNFGVVSIGLFGSYAKDEQNPESDIDFIVELSSPSFNNLAGLQIFLEKKFDKKIELIRMRKGLSELFIERINKEVHYA
jgi:predicted nucleotidyltransferase